MTSIAIQGALPAEIERKLRDYPFSMRPIRRLRSETPVRFDAETHRKIIRTKLRCDMAIIDEDIHFLEAHPEAIKWLKNHTETQLWMKIQSLLEPSQDGGTIRTDRAER